MMSFMLPAGVGAALGPAQTFLLREYVDTPMANDFLNGKTTTYPFVKPLKGFGTPSALAGIVGGIIGLSLGYVGAKKGKIIKTFNGQLAMITYGASALTSGLLSGIYPTSAASTAIARDPDNPIFTASSSNRGSLVITQPPMTAPTIPTTQTPNQQILANF
jgi:hypothetical protein